MMLFTLLKFYAIWLLISVFVCLIGFSLTLLISPSQARTFFVSYVYYWNGFIVAMSGFGALNFSIVTCKPRYHFLISEILAVSNEQKVILFSDLDKLISLSNKQIIAIPVFLIGSTILYICGYPMSGFPKYFLWISSSAMFYAGGLMMAYTVYSLKLFHTIDKNSEHIELQDNVNLVELENFNFYLSVLSLVATVALYFAFRGTLTANFTFTPPHDWIGDLFGVIILPAASYEAVRNLLVYPIVIFLPFLLFSGFYMKLVLRNIYLNDVKRKILDIDILTKSAIKQAGSKDMDIMEIRKAALELKEKTIENNKVIPLVTLKDAPSIALFLIIILQFIWINDEQVKGFFDNLIGAKS